MKQRETSADIDDAAADWAARIDAMPSDATIRSELDDWLAGDPRRLGAYARARAVLAYAGGLKERGWNNTAAEPSLIERPVDEPQAKSSSRLFEQVSRSRINRRTFLFAGGATVAAGVAGTSMQASAHTYSTALGEIRLVPLADGSSMTLNTASTARVRFTDDMRHVELLGGEALFDVTQDIARPFVVEAADTNVRAAGTSFVVRRLPRQSIEVMVRQGSVDINRAGLRQSASRHVAANKRAVLSRATTEIVTYDVQPSEVALELAWREGMLAFEDTPLRRAADQFARYSNTRIVITEPAVGNETVTGLFAANDPAGFARAVALSLGLKADAGSGSVVLHR